MCSSCSSNYTEILKLRAKDITIDEKVIAYNLRGDDLIAYGEVVIAKIREIADLWEKEDQ